MKVLNKVFGGVRMTWLKVIIFAVAAAVVTAVIAIIPAFTHTSIHNIDVCFEAWVIFAMFIILNCEKPLEAALKTFVFFLISQPLIYLIQVPFCSLGFGIFKFYPTWGIWTAATFPGALVIWFVKKQNWFSVVLLAVVNVMLLGIEFAGHLVTLVDSFPKQLIACLFILAEVVVLILVCFKDKLKRIISAAAALVICIVFILFSTNLILVKGASSTSLLGGTGPYTVVSCDEGMEAVITDEGELTLKAKEFGTYEIKIEDADGELSDIVFTYDSSGICTESK